MTDMKKVVKCPRTRIQMSIYILTKNYAIRAKLGAGVKAKADQQLLNALFIQLTFHDFITSSELQLMTEGKITQIF